MAIEAAEKCKNWREEMGHWYVVSSAGIPETNSSLIIGAGGEILGARSGSNFGISVTVQGPWRLDGGDRETLEFVVDRMPKMWTMAGVMGTRFLEMDGICPSGAIRVWSEHEDD